MNESDISSDAPGQKLFLLGNEAIARGAIEAGVQVAAAYPGTPSSEILETLAKVAPKLDIYVEWSTNEKVAFERGKSYGINETCRGQRCPRPIDDRQLYRG